MWQWLQTQTTCRKPMLPGSHLQLIRGHHLAVHGGPLTAIPHGSRNRRLRSHGLAAARNVADISVAGLLLCISKTALLGLGPRTIPSKSLEATPSTTQVAALVAVTRPARLKGQHDDSETRRQRSERLLRLCLLGRPSRLQRSGQLLRPCLQGRPSRLKRSGQLLRPCPQGKPSRPLHAHNLHPFLRLPQPRVQSSARLLHLFQPSQRHRLKRLLKSRRRNLWSRAHTAVVLSG